MKKKKLFLTVASALIVCAVAVFVIGYISNTSAVQIAVPVLNKETGKVDVAMVSEPGQGLFASIVAPVANREGFFVRIFDETELPVDIKADQPDDAIIFECPSGSNVPVSGMFSQFHKGEDAWLWGPYDGTETQRILNGEDPATVFVMTKMGGRANGFDGDPDWDSNRSLGEGTFFASADLTGLGVGAVQVRCEVANPTVCADGWLDSGECDDAGVDSATCDSDCTAQECGDNHVNAVAGEACDDGGVDTASCNQDCSLVSCGDGYVNAAAGETCDDGEDNGKFGFCNNGCTGPTEAVCGNGDVEGDEGCDDGNQDNTDACPDGEGGSCQSATCGDGFVWTGFEPCDDGNTTNEDACMNWCALNTCGDGIIGDGGGLECDDGATCFDAQDAIMWCTPTWTAGVLTWMPPTGCVTACVVQSGDGCTDACIEETNFACPGETQSMMVDGVSTDVLRGKCYYGAPSL